MIAIFFVIRARSEGIPGTSSPEDALYKLKQNPTEEGDENYVKHESSEIPLTLIQFVLVSVILEELSREKIIEV